MRLFPILLISHLFALCAAPAAAQDNPQARDRAEQARAATEASGDTPACRLRGGPDDRPRIGLVLGGGGARGLAHVAVLQELERLGVPVDCIAGTSMGALVGGLYASGMNAQQIEDELRKLQWATLFSDRLERPERSFRRKRDDDLALVPGKPGIGNEGVKLGSGLLAGERVLLLLERLTQPVARRAHFDDLPIPFRAVSTDLNTGQAVVHDRGQLSLAMRASMSIPGVFQPVVIDEHVLVDGGLANQLPVDVARAMGADIVIAVDVGTPLVKLGADASLLAIVDQITGFMTVGGTRTQVETLGTGDVLVRPPLGTEIGTGEFEKMDRALAIGREGLGPVQARLAALAPPLPVREALLASRPAPDPGPPVIDLVRLNNHSDYDDIFLLSRIDIAPGQPLDTERLQRNLGQIYALDTLSLVTYDLVQEDDKTVLVVDVQPDPRGPNYLETGLSLYSDFSGDFFVNLRMGVLRAPMNPLGGEVRGLLQLGDEPGLLLDWYQPLDVKGEWFATAALSYESPKFGLFAGGERLANYSAPNWGGEVLLGREYGNYGAATLALRRRFGEARVEVGDPLLDGLDYDIGEAELSLVHDRIDSPYLPRRGNYAVASALVSRTALGADADFEQYNLDLLHARLIGKHSGFVGLRYHVSSNDLIPIQSGFRLGGLTRFAGYRPNEVLAENYGLAYAGYTYELGRVLNRPAVLGGTLEYGRTWGVGQDLDDGEDELHASVYFGFDSWLGTLLFGYGIREGGDGVFLLELGRPR